MLLQGENVIITGTRRGIGRAMTEEFARNGAHIWAHARQETPEFLADMAEIAAKYSVEIRPLCFELTDREAMQAAVQRLIKAKVPIDGLVNNAGVIHNSLFTMTRESDLRQVFEVNFMAPFLFTQYVAKLMMRKKQGAIVSLASSAAFDGNPGQAVYGATKAAIVAMTQSLAHELGSYGIRANCIAPGIIGTDMMEVMSEKAVREVKEDSALRRCGSPVDIAKTAVFLISDMSAYLTGQVIRVDGGMRR